MTCGYLIMLRAKTFIFLLKRSKYYYNIVSCCTPKNLKALNPSHLIGTREVVATIYHNCTVYTTRLGRCRFASPGARGPLGVHGSVMGLFFYGKNGQWASEGPTDA